MIEYARHGVAMENGLQELKDVKEQYYIQQ